MAFPALAGAGAASGGASSAGAGGAGGAAGGGMFGNLLSGLMSQGSKMAEDQMNKASGAKFLADMDAIAQGNANAQLAGGQAMASGAGIQTPGADVAQFLTAQDEGASQSRSNSLQTFRDALAKKEKAKNKKSFGQSLEEDDE